ncbi:hypothetical protein NLJ89_g3935 [Agrocybe chaxingu]|uniref:Thioesterase/thiol ester dehydrase-isomerase n=1 Tax=Agrocybe chaxingu TaxID=84603 RepID=A0A9W8K1I7_9AGAR|nr:hypothetical protein NLJ89_g3935 [Agrocybe chaxingu]
MFRTGPSLSKFSASLRTRSQRHTSSTSGLYAAFKDSSSPFHTLGPDPSNTLSMRANLTTLAQEPSTGIEALGEAKEALLRKGLDPQSFWEQRIVWGDQDPFQHVNNVRYIRFFESARIKWMLSLGEELGGPSRAAAMIKAQGVSLILKTIEVQFKRPVTFPDTLLIGYRPVPLASDHTDVATFHAAASAYSLSQKAFVAHTKEALVWYDYDTLKKCHPGERALEVLWGRVWKE